ncbi:hypothetical protein CF319_g4077 [Tilletia indica]|nr:hypothetical protein CF319_g4077 [Tilletia indica]
MDLYSRFDLPPPPPPNFLTRDHSASRARFPELQDAAELMDFVRVMVIWDFPAWVIVTYIVTIFVVCIYVAVSLVIIVKKLRRRASWILRFGNKGSLVIPHAQNSTMLCYAIYEVLILGCICELYFAHRAGRTIRHGPLWVTGLILPLAAGALFQVWGLVIAAIPKQLSGALISSRAPAQVLNSIFIGPPLAFLVLCMTLTGISDYHWNQIDAKDWPAFQHRYGSETELSREMLVDAQKIWDHLLQSALFLSINFIVWVVIGFVMIFLHASIVLRTVMSLRKFLAKHEAIQRRLGKGGASDSKHTASQSSRRFLSKQMARIRGFRDQYSSRGTGSLQTKSDNTGSDPARSPIEPPLEQESPVYRSETPTGTAPMMGQQWAQKVLVYFTGQCACVSMGGISMIGLGIALTATLYPAMEQQSRAPIIALALVSLCYITLGIGLVNVASLAYSSFEAPFSALIQAKISAAETAHGQSVFAKADAKNLLLSEVKDRSKAGQGSQSSPRAQSPSHEQVKLESLHSDAELRFLQFSREREGRPNSVCRPTPPEAIVLHSRKTSPTALSGGSANSSTNLVLPALQFSYYDQAAGAESASSFQVSQASPTTPISTARPPPSQLQPTEPQSNRPSWAPFSSYYEA